MDILIEHYKKELVERNQQLANLEMRYATAIRKNKNYKKAIRQLQLVYNYATTQNRVLYERINDLNNEIQKNKKK